MAPSLFQLAAALLLALGAAKANPVELASVAARSCASMTCPTGNKATCTDAKGDSYKIYCATQLEGLQQFPGAAQSEPSHLLPRVGEATLEKCLELCDANPGCKAVSYYLNNCELYDSVTKMDASKGTMSAVRV